MAADRSGSGGSALAQNGLAPTEAIAPETVAGLTAAISACRQCAAAFAATATAHAPRPVPWLSDRAPILIAGQAPGAQVHAKGRPFDDRSGDRLRDWLGVDRATFYDRARFAVLPMAFCFPGYDAAGAPTCRRRRSARGCGGRARSPRCRRCGSSF
jgi:uracil-DNA glycosylase